MKREYICEVYESLSPQYTKKQELIRCKNCKYYDADGFQCETDKPHSGTWFPESYCDRAERKEE